MPTLGWGVSFIVLAGSPQQLVFGIYGSPGTIHPLHPELFEEQVGEPVGASQDDSKRYTSRNALDRKITWSKLHQVRGIK